MVRKISIVLLFILLCAPIATAQEFPAAMGSVGITGEAIGPDKGEFGVRKIVGVNVLELFPQLKNAIRGLNDTTATLYMAYQHDNWPGFGGGAAKLVLAICTKPETKNWLTLLLSGAWLNDIAYEGNPQAEDPQLEDGYSVGFGLHIQLSSGSLGNVILYGEAVERGIPGKAAIHLSFLYTIGG